MIYKCYLKIKSRFIYNFLYLNIIADPTKQDYVDLIDYKMLGTHIISNDNIDLLQESGYDENGDSDSFLSSSEEFENTTKGQANIAARVNYLNDNGINYWIDHHGETEPTL